jgi:hypothetical protein
MTLDRTSTVAAFVAASLAYIAVTTAFTGRFDVTAWFVFAASFLLLLYIGERAFGRWTGE